jgi:hypothetical protein
LNGGYDDFIEASTLENVIVAVLKDVGLVWHNCFIFNAPGSAIFRMAQVQRATAHRIIDKSLDGIVSSQVKDKIRESKASIGSVRRQAKCSQQVSKKTQSSRREIAVKHIDCGRNRIKKGKPVAVLDPGTGRVVKMYSTATAAILVVEMFVELGYPCEWALTNGKLPGLTIRRIIKESSKIDHRLFGYRWVHVHELKAGCVRFGQPQQGSRSTLGDEGDDGPVVKLNGDSNISQID